MLMFDLRYQDKYWALISFIPPTSMNISMRSKRYLSLALARLRPSIVLPVIFGFPGNRFGQTNCQRKPACREPAANLPRTWFEPGLNLV